MSKIFDSDSDSEFHIKTNNEYAKQYDTWRKKEEINKIKTKYGEDSLTNQEESSSSSDDDEDGVEVTEELERDFYKTLACLKNKDPRIYDENVNFFQDKQVVSKNEKKKKQKPMFIKDYERTLILEKGGQLSDSENEEANPRSSSPTYVEEQKQIKESFKKVLQDDKDEEDGEWGGLFKTREKSKEQKEKEDADYKEWLVGQRKDLGDKNMETELKPLKDYWGNPKLDENEKFLRDYVLKKKFLDNDDDDYVPTYDEVIHDSDENLSNDEEVIEKQDEFEHKYNFRFEEPDQDFIKRYPRTLENSLRRKDDRRKLKRAEIKERKQIEKQEKMNDLQKLRELKRKEIEEKIEKLKEITGNTDVPFDDEDLDGDFDPDAHDKRMKALFDDEFYQGPESDQKPEFPDLDDELEIENWEKYGDTENFKQQNDQEPHCEDDDFNMDCEYDAQAATQKQLIENSKGKKKRKRKSKFAQVINEPKPKFDPNDKTYEKYLEEYYKLDCEDFIGDIPCRFKYREVIPNDFGLTTEEILLAKDRELNRWCSLKKVVQHRPEHVEKYDKIAFSKKSQNINLKQKVLSSLFSPAEDEIIPIKNNSETKSIDGAEECIDSNNSESTVEKIEETSIKKTDKNLESLESNENTEGKKKRKNKKINKNLDFNLNKKIIGVEEKSTVKNTKNKNKKSVTADNSISKDDDVSNKRKRKNTTSTASNGPRSKKLKNNRRDDKNSAISDARLTAYGINPKKYKNKLKYGTK